MKTVTVDLGSMSYTIRIGKNAGFGPFLATWKPSRVLIVSDTNVDSLYGEACAGRLRSEGIHHSKIVINAGEASKTMENVLKVYDKALESGLDRKSAFIALGGGMVGDLAGFAAATYLRGVPFIQMPTSLLAMVDSSVGGKTGVNLPRGKNLAGAFYQPAEVNADTGCLSTLSAQDYRSGLAEVVKYGVIWDGALFQDLEANADRIMRREESPLEDIICRCCEIKSEVVALDEREGGIRAVLNYGHTLGHALEAGAGYGNLSHGDAVAIGMVFAARVSVLQGRMNSSEEKRLSALLETLGLPVRLPCGAAAEWQKTRGIMASDKKARKGVLLFVLADRIGSVKFGCEVNEQTLEEAFNSIMPG